MKQKNILILGDSTSMTIGLEKRMYPFYLAGMEIWAPEIQIVNCSLPGFTSADACAFFFQEIKNLEPLAAVIIYLGNCDAVSSELRKGKYSHFRQWRNSISNVLRKEKRRTRLKNRLLPFEWNDDFDGAIEAPDPVNDYEYNISRIISVCQQKELPVILVRPQAHVLFPSGVGKGNFLFYKYLGIHDHIADQVSIADHRFKEALRLQETKEFGQAMEAYKDILGKSGMLSSNLEYQSLVVNNYAVCAAEAHLFEEAECLLQLLLKERGARREIILYNLAQLYRLKGDIGEYKKILKESYESDKSMYRIREPYKLAIDRIAKKFFCVHVIDLKDFIGDDDYIDHCHPIPEKQKLIAHHIAGKLRSPELQGDRSLEIKNRLYNPEYSLGNGSEFHKYFKTFAQFSSDEIKDFISMIKISLKDTERLNSDFDATFPIPKILQRAFKYYLGHPCFPRWEDVLKAGPFLPSDVGRFPEYFLFRYLIPYLEKIEKTPELNNIFNPGEGLLRSSKQFHSILPEATIEKMENDDLILDLEYERFRLPAILEKIRSMLLGNLRKGPQIYVRLKTTIFWYFRETLRFGAHSRISMRYERVQLEFMAEGLAVAGVLDFHMAGKKRLEIQQLMRWLQETVQTHEHFCRQFSLEHNCTELLNQYNSKLMEIVQKMGTVDPPLESQAKMESGKCIS